METQCTESMSLKYFTNLWNQNTYIKTRQCYEALLTEMYLKIRLPKHRLSTLAQQTTKKEAKHTNHKDNTKQDK
jgi:hypothetical protein